MVTLEGKSGNFQITNAEISANYFQLLGIPIIRGRAFEPRENTWDQHVIIVSESTARKFWPGEDPIGKRVRVSEANVYQEVVGVSKDIRATGLGAVDPVFIYFAAGSKTHPSHSLLARGTAGEAVISKAIREEVQALDSNVLVQTGSLENNLALFQLPSRILSILAFALGRSRAAAGLARDLRRDGLCGDPADQGDRHPHDHGRTATRRDATYPRPVHEAGSSRRRRRPGS